MTASRGAGIVVVGASLAGVAAGEALREAGYEGPVRIVGAEPHLPYDRPPLSKAFLTAPAPPGGTVLRDERWYADRGLDLWLGRRACRLDPPAHRLALDGGEWLGYEGLVVATGATPRRLRLLEGYEGVFVLRTLDDAAALRGALDARPRVAVIGGGFLGLEVAASARQRGCEVVVVELLPAPLAAALGTAVGEVLAGLHAAHGTRVHAGVAVEAVLGAGRVEGLVLSDGRRVGADVVVVAVGVEPATGWLEGSGVALDDGVVVDSSLRASAPGVVAAGDVARVHPGPGQPSWRVEHWTNAVEQGRLAARNLLAPGAGPPSGFDAVLSFWSDQYDARIRSFGTIPDPGAVEVVRHEREPLRLVALAPSGDALAGAVTVNAASALARLRPLIGREGGYALARQAFGA